MPKLLNISVWVFFCVLVSDIHALMLQALRVEYTYKECRWCFQLDGIYSNHL